MKQEQVAKKKAIVVISFGTSYLETIKLNIESIENRIRLAFPEYDVRRAFTSRIIIKRLLERDGIQVDNERQALERLQAEGYREVYIQPLHIVPGAEYDKIKSLVDYFTHSGNKTFDKICLGRPLLYYAGQEGLPDDYEAAIKALAIQLSEVQPASAIVLMGHGGLHPANAAYGAFQLRLEDAGLNHVFIYTVEGFPALSRVITKLKQKQVRNITLMPFLLVAGEHATNDMAGDEEHSAKSQLVSAGFTVSVYFRGLGENTAIQDIYVNHLRELITHPLYKEHEH